MRKNFSWTWLSWPLSQHVHINPANAWARCMMLIHKRSASLNAYQQSHSGGKTHVLDFLLALRSHCSVGVNALWWFCVVKWAVAHWSEYTRKCSTEFGVMSVQKAWIIVKPFLSFRSIEGIRNYLFFFNTNLFHLIARLKFFKSKTKKPQTH